MFKVLEHNIGRFKAIRLLNQKTEEYAEILTDFGAGLNDLVIKTEAGDLTSVIDGYRSEAEVINDHHTAFKGSKLSPFPNRIVAGKYQFEGKEYELPINEVGANNNLHAFLHNRPFEVAEMVERSDSAVLMLNYQYLGIDQGYPFTYELKIAFEYSVKGLKVETKITNTDNKNIPIGDGWHPYFAFNAVDDLLLKMDTARRVSSNFGNELCDTHEYEFGKKIGSHEMDDCYEINAADFSLSMTDSNAGIDLTVKQQSSSNQYRYLQIYTPPTRKSIAIEPVTCAPNAFNTGQGLIVLEPELSIKMKFEILT